MIQRLRLRESISFQRPQTLSSELRSNVQLMEVVTIDSSDAIKFIQTNLGITVTNKEADTEIFVPWSMVRSLESPFTFQPEPSIFPKQTKKK